MGFEAPAAFLFQLDLWGMLQQNGLAETAVLVILILFSILGYSVVTSKYMNSLVSKNPVTIEVVGHQWWWEVNYPNSQPDLTVSTANEIHVPVGVPVVLQTSSADVIHSFWAPNIQGKRDLIPGYQNAIWFQVATFGAVLLLVFLLKARGPQQQGQGGAPARAEPPMPAEA